MVFIVKPVSVYRTRGARNNALTNISNTMRALCRLVLSSGNQLRCDCALRRLRSWMDDRAADPASPWHQVTCETPAEVRGQTVTQLDVAGLTCVGPQQDASQYQQKPDIVFRSIHG